MNAFEMETKLAENGFNRHDLAALRQYLEKGHATYPGLLTELSIRFVAAMALVAILSAAGIYTLLFKDQLAILSYSITMIIVAPIFYFCTPIKLGYKAFRFNCRH